MDARDDGAARVRRKVLIIDDDALILAALERQLSTSHDVVVFSDRALSGEQALQALIKENPALATSRAARDKRLLSLDPTLLVGGLGPRLPATLHELAASFYPAAKASFTP